MTKVESVRHMIVCFVLSEQLFVDVVFSPDGYIWVGFCTTITGNGFCKVHTAEMVEVE